MEDDIKNQTQDQINLKLAQHMHKIVTHMQALEARIIALEKVAIAASNEDEDTKKIWHGYGHTEQKK